MGLDPQDNGITKTVYVSKLMFWSKYRLLQS